MLSNSVQQVSKTSPPTLQFIDTSRVTHEQYLNEFKERTGWSRPRYQERNVRNSCHCPGAVDRFSPDQLETCDIYVARKETHQHALARTQPQARMRTQTNTMTNVRILTIICHLRRGNLLCVAPWSKSQLSTDKPERYVSTLKLMSRYDTGTY